MKTVFAKKQSRSVIGTLRGVQPRFSSEALRDAVAQVIKECGLPEDELFDNGQKPRCKVFVCTKFQKTNASTRLRNYRLPSGDDHRPTILQAALATSAAPTYFSDIAIDGMKFVDGALGANNPAFEVVEEASDLWCEDTGNIQSLTKCFISIGTGHPGIRSVSDRGLRHLVETLKKEATETENTNNIFLGQWREHLDNGRCFRFNVDHGLEDVGLAEWEQGDLLKSSTATYLKGRNTIGLVKSCVANLRMKEYADKKLKENMHLKSAQNIQPMVSRPTMSEIAELVKTGNANLKIPYARRTQTNLLNARHCFHKALHYLQNDPASSPKEVARVCQKLLETDLGLSMKAPSSNHHERRQHADQALEYGQAALDNCVRINNQTMVVQVQFMLAALGIWRVYIQAKASGAEPRFCLGREDALTQMHHVLNALKSIPNMDHAGYEEEARYYAKWLDR
ncbi:hypothetical protein N0V90_007593 [Kalmusia sp. IMI 367209]|nr:hypothetical protein N0V90_007593 [Kalmusia sp. IMI 367209]